MSKPRRQGSRDDARNDKPSGSLDEITALIKERRKYVDWIAGLEAKRAQTPDNVYVRVHADYEERLAAVDQKLDKHREALATEQARLHKKLQELEDQIEKAQDKRDEIELRAHVGELGAAALTEALRSADTGLQRLTDNRRALTTDLDRIGEFFSATATGTMPASEARKSAANFDELGFLQSVVGAGKDSRPAASPQPKPRTGEIPAVRADETKAAATKTGETRAVAPTVTGETAAVPAKPVESKPAEVEPAEAKASESKPAETKADEPKPVETKAPEAKAADAKPVEAKPVEAKPVEAKPDDTRPAAAKPRDSLELEREESPPPKAVPKPSFSEYQPAVPESIAPPEPKPVAPSRPSIAMHMASMTFEPPPELPSSIVKANESAPSLLDGISSKTEPGQKPLAANVASNNPLSLKSTGPGEAKTLKCRECGAMNASTEWYCERCGAELSAI